MVWFIVKYSPSVESSYECGFNLEAAEGVQSGGPSEQIKRHPPELSAVWAFVSESSQFSLPSLVNNNGGSREPGRGGGLWSAPPRPKQRQTGGEEERAKP